MSLPYCKYQRRPGLIYDPSYLWQIACADYANYADFLCE